MDSKTLAHAAANEPTGWKTEEYHGRQMRVCASLRTPENEALAGHGQQWTFTVMIDDKGASATSDAGFFYSTQAVAEDMGFLRGRELIDGT